MIILYRLMKLQWLRYSSWLVQVPCFLVVGSKRERGKQIAVIEAVVAVYFVSVI